MPAVRVVIGLAFFKKFRQPGG